MTHPAPAARLALGADLNLAAAEPLRERLATALEAGEALMVDGAKVERTSTACLQVLVAAARQARRAGLAWLILDPSAALAEAVHDLALHNELLPRT